LMMLPEYFCTEVLKPTRSPLLQTIFSQNSLTASLEILSSGKLTKGLLRIVVIDMGSKATTAESVSPCAQFLPVYLVQFPLPALLMIKY
jgi:hypothetical protein